MAPKSLHSRPSLSTSQMCYLCKTVTASHTLLAPDSKICYSRGRDFLALQGQSVLQIPPDCLSSVWHDLGQQGQSCSAAAQTPRDGDVAQGITHVIISHTHSFHNLALHLENCTLNLTYQIGNEPSLQLLLVPFSELECFPSASFPTDGEAPQEQRLWLEGEANQRPGLSIPAEQNSGAASASLLYHLQPTRS